MKKLLLFGAILIGSNLMAQTPGGGVTDSEGNSYETVIIGNQEWMAENLKTLPAVIGSGTNSSTDPYYYVYDYQFTDPAEAKLTSNFTTYGVLYNWTAVMGGEASSDANPSGIQGICPTGWHVPSDSEWIELEEFLGMCSGTAVGCSESFGDRGTDEGKKLKSETGWNNGDDPTNNSSGFSALPGGQNEGWTAYFWQLGSGGNFWTSTEFSSNYAVMRRLGDVNSTVLRGEVGQPGSTKSTGKSCRCVKDLSGVGLIELNDTPKTLVKIVDLMGRETEFRPNAVLIYIYDDGSTERLMKIEE
ncbi:fibrobacter succinogenes major paralogous domain-containing protein [Crocinitomicaceae bacterium]|nr:fibrobacter succinogenes major paralogous domain-containing protein [Crocinitomicaceae bacterium]MDC0459342.1 fibrobacter succinogenes major paralogous domain-containing protein [Crocinitomicaceae bacterium]